MGTVYIGPYANGHFFDDDHRPLPRRIVAAAVGEIALGGMTVARALELSEKAAAAMSALPAGPEQTIAVYKIFIEMVWQETMKAVA